MLLVSAALTTTTLLVVRLTVQNQVRREIQSGLGNSVLTFQDFQRQREETLARSAQLLADLPNVRALMTTRDRATIQDASSGGWHLAGAVHGHKGGGRGGEDEKGPTGAVASAGRSILNRGATSSGQE